MTYVELKVDSQIRSWTVDLVRDLAMHGVAWRTQYLQDIIGIFDGPEPRPDIYDVPDDCEFSSMRVKR